MDEPTPLGNNPLPAVIAPPEGTDAIPTLGDLAIDTSWGEPTTAAPTITELAQPEEPPQPTEAATGWQRLLPGPIRHWLEERAFRASVIEVGTEETEAIEREPDSPMVTIAKTLVAFLASTAFAYLILTFPSQIARASYVIAHFGKTDTPAKIVSGNQTNGRFADVVVPALSFKPPANQPAAAVPAATNSPFSNLGDNQIYIPKIDQHAPIIWDSSFEEKAMLANLQKGVVHYGGTDFPSTVKGNVFITGHSSYYWWDSGKYKTVFANLDKLSNGDQVAITYQGHVFVYQVFDKIVVPPSQTDVLNSTDKPILTLMTCTPVGTSLNRLIVKSNLVGEFDEGSATGPTTPTATPTSTPTAAPSQQPTSTIQNTTPSDSLDLLPGLR